MVNYRQKLLDASKAHKEREPETIPDWLARKNRENLMKWRDKWARVSPERQNP